MAPHSEEKLMYRYRYKLAYKAGYCGFAPVMFCTLEADFWSDVGSILVGNKNPSIDGWTLLSPVIKYKGKLTDTGN